MSLAELFASMAGMVRREEEYVFDWDKAAKIILKEEAENAEAGLKEDWFWTGGPILEEGKIPEYEDGIGLPFLSSVWATPILRIGEKDFPCWRKESEVPEWNHATYWPESARRILKGE